MHMPAITQILIALAAIVIVAEFYLVFRTRADRKIGENLDNNKGK